jgi:hypothetical protein
MPGLGASSQSMGVRHRGFRDTVDRFLRIGAVWAWGMLLTGEIYAQKLEVPDAPTPKVEELRPGHNPWYSLDRTALSLGLVQAGAEIFDGIGTRHFTNGPASCYWCYEQDPLVRPFIGAKPTWVKLIAFGAIEDVASIYLDQSMRRSRRKFIHRLGSVMPLALSTIHISKGYGVLTANTNLCTDSLHLGPNFHPVPVLGGYTCVTSVETPSPGVAAGKGHRKQ